MLSDVNIIANLISFFSGGKIDQQLLLRVIFEEDERPDSIEV